MNEVWRPLNKTSFPPLLLNRPCLLGGLDVRAGLPGAAQSQGRLTSDSRSAEIPARRSRRQHTAQHSSSLQIQFLISFKEQEVRCSFVKTDWATETRYFRVSWVVAFFAIGYLALTGPRLVSLKTRVVWCGVKCEKHFHFLSLSLKYLAIGFVLTRDFNVSSYVVKIQFEMFPSGFTSIIVVSTGVWLVA